MLRMNIEKPFYILNGFLTVELENGFPCALTKEQYPELWAEAQAYLAEHPDALIPDPLPPEPTAEESAAQARAAIQVQLDELDRKTIRPLRAGETDRVSELEAKAVELRAQLAKVAP